MNQQAAADFRAADVRLNRIYQKVLAASSDDEARTKLIKAQRAWIVYRDAQAEFEADEARGGSMEPMLRWGTMAALTRERIKALTPATP